jgi:hypothetical protein
MSTSDERKAEIKKLLKRLRAERVDHLKAVRRNQKKISAPRRALKKALAQGPQTVPQLAQALNQTTDEVLWHMAAMRCYGLVAEDEQDGDYFKYRLVPVKK